MEAQLTRLVQRLRKQTSELKAGLTEQGREREAGQSGQSLEVSAAFCCCLANVSPGPPDLQASQNRPTSPPAQNTSGGLCMGQELKDKTKDQATVTPANLLQSSGALSEFLPPFSNGQK